MPARTLRLMGRPAVVDPTGSQPLPLDLRTALIGALACRDDAMPRQRLVAVFWPDAPESIARQNLRGLVYRSRRLLGAEAFAASTTSVGLRFDHDLRALHAALAAGDGLRVVMGAALELLDGLEVLPNEEWRAFLQLERRSLYESARRVVLEAAAGWARHGPPPGALPALARWVDRDPFDEALLVAYLHCARRTPNEGPAAAARLARATETVQEELGAGLSEAVVMASVWLGEGGAATRVTADAAASTAARVTADAAVRGTSDVTPADGATIEPSAHAGVADAATAPSASPSAAALVLFGRERELAALRDAIAEPATRVVTLHGPGGVGKTRLARAWAADTGAGRPALPVVEVALATDAPDATRRVAHAHGWHTVDVDPDSSLSDLAHRLERGSGVLVLDEAEAKPWFAAWLEQLLERAPSVTVVVTSRERLGVTGEQVLPIAGLAQPADDDVATVWRSDAVRLFLHAARRVRPEMAFDADALEAIARFARRVDGSPLALTVAASWLQLGPPAVVLDQLIEAPDDPLAIGEVMARSWQPLSSHERFALAALSVFADRFDTEAAIAVAGCDRRTLLRFVDAALIEPGSVDGLALHALVRHHAAQQLAPAEAEAVRARHARYVATWLGGAAADLWGGPRQHASYTMILRHLDDLRQAWAWACERRDAAVLDALADTVWALEIRGWYALGAALTSAAVQSLEAETGDRHDGTELVLARLLARRGIFAHRHGDVATTRETAVRARAIFERQEVRVDPFVWFHLGIADHFDGNTEGSIAWHLRLLAEAEAAGDRWAANGARGNLAILSRDRGDIDAALEHARPALLGAQALDDRWGSALCGLLTASLLARRGEQLNEAIEVLVAAVEDAERFAMESVLVEQLAALGDLCLRTGRTAQAHGAYRRAQTLLDAGVFAGVRSPEHGGVDEAHFAALVEAGLRATAASLS